MTDLDIKSMRWLILPLRRFMNNSASSGIVLFGAALLAMLMANSPWHEEFHHFWELSFTIGWEGFRLEQSLHHWINDGLMSMFFFVVGLELKRELIDGELRDPRHAVLPIIAAVFGMLLPAIIYLSLNLSPSTRLGWGIPMATDIAFALGVLYLLGDRVPTAAKVFLTSIAIVDDLGAVLVIALFYTSDINFVSLLVGLAFLLVLAVANRLGVRNTSFYGIIGIGGIWVSFFMSGIHPTIAAVLIAFTIPARGIMPRRHYLDRMNYLIGAFQKTQVTPSPLLTERQMEIVEKIREVTKAFLPPLQRLEHALHPFVAYVVMPLFALSNAGVRLTPEVLSYVGSSVTIGIFLGLLLGKTLGIFGVSWLLVRLKMIRLPEGIHMQHIMGLSLLAAIGFTMSLFIAGLASDQESFILQAKLGILSASLIAGVLGYTILRYSYRMQAAVIEPQSDLVG